MPAVLWHGRALVISYVSLFSELRDEAEWCDSELSLQLAGSGFRSDVWCAVCEDPEVPLTHHRVAASLRLLPSMPRTFLNVPTCRFCAVSEGNQSAHVQYCSVLYLRMGPALTARERKSHNGYGSSLVTSQICLPGCRFQGVCWLWGLYPSKRCRQ